MTSRCQEGFRLKLLVIRNLLPPRVFSCKVVLEIQSGNSITLKKCPKKDPKVNLLQAYAWTPRKSLTYTVSGTFSLRKFQYWFNWTKVHPKKGLKKGPTFSRPFLMPLNRPLGDKLYVYTGRSSTTASGTLPSFSSARLSTSSCFSSTFGPLTREHVRRFVSGCGLLWNGPVKQDNRDKLVQIWRCLVSEREVQVVRHRRLATLPNDPGREETSCESRKID